MDFSQARFNMIEQQIRPWGVLDPTVLNLLSKVKREDFVSPAQQTLAFSDMELPLPNSTLMLQPKQEARFIQALELKLTDKVLEIGTGSGYITALLAHLTQHVYSVEVDSAMITLAQQNLTKINVKNITLIQANGLDGLAEMAPFDVIFVSGSLPVMPEILKRQLATGGRMIVTLGDTPAMSAYLIKRDSENSINKTALFETYLPRLIGYERIEPERFVF